MLYIGWMVILWGHNIKKNKFLKLPFFELPTVKRCMSRLCTNLRRRKLPPPPPSQWTPVKNVTERWFSKRGLRIVEFDCC